MSGLKLELQRAHALLDALFDDTTGS
jgi:hypothetical protein